MAPEASRVAALQRKTTYFGHFWALGIRGFLFFSRFSRLLVAANPRVSHDSCGFIPLCWSKAHYCGGEHPNFRLVRDYSKMASRSAIPKEVGRLVALHP